LRARWPERWNGLSSSLGLDEAELQEWLAVADTIATGFDANTELYEQFAGFFGLEQIDLTNYAGRSVPMDVVLGRERTSGSQIVKQADVVALLALLPEEFPAGAGAANFRYYEPRCGHGSSLSRAMHGLVAARLGETEKALQYFQDTAAIDLADTHVAIGGGVHIAALGGVWQMAVLGFAGLSLRDDGVAIDPQMPAAWHSLRFAIQWRGRRVRLCIRPPGEMLEAILEAGAPMTLFLSGVAHELDRDRPLRIVPETAAKADTKGLGVKSPCKRSAPSVEPTANG
jgi:trehalose/maltose hydrolase-like predicted phosphorylase